MAQVGRSNDDMALDGLSAQLTPEELSSLEDRALKNLSDAMNEGDLKKAQVSKMVLQETRRGIVAKTGKIVQLDEKFCDAVKLFSESEFRPTSRLAPYADVIRKPKRSKQASS